MATAMSASIHWIIWCSPIGTPKAFRSRAYATERAYAPAAIPSAWAAIPTRPPSIADRAILNPWPSSPRRFAAGTRQPSKTSSAVSDARIPSLSSVLVTVNPGVPFSTTKAEMPRCPWARSVWQKTSANDASRPVVMKRLQPSIT